jgi:hypothetical protein
VEIRRPQNPLSREFTDDFSRENRIEYTIEGSEVFKIPARKTIVLSPDTSRGLLILGHAANFLIDKYRNRPHCVVHLSFTVTATRSFCKMGRRPMGAQRRILNRRQVSGRIARRNSRRIGEDLLLYGLSCSAMPNLCASVCCMLCLQGFAWPHRSQVCSADRCSVHGLYQQRFCVVLVHHPGSKFRRFG